MRKPYYYMLWLTLFSWPAHADPTISKYIKDAQAVGSGDLKFMFWDIYQGTLYAPNGSWNSQTPFALKLDYKRPIDRHTLAKTSAEEMRALGLNNEIVLATWYKQMQELFPDVMPGNTIIGIHFPQTGKNLFYHNDQFIGSIDDPEFGKWFFNIWLAKNTSAPKLRAALLGYHD